MYEKLYLDNIKDLKNIAMKYFRYDVQMAEDVVQSFFLKIIKNKATVVGSPKSYIRTAFYNHCASTYTRDVGANSNKAKTTNYDPSTDYRVDKHTPESICSRRSSLRHAKTLMKRRKLSPKVINMMLTIMNHGSYRSAAKELGVSMNMLKVYMSQNRHLFKDIGYAAPPFIANRLT